MALPSLSFIAGLLGLFYLSTFVLFTLVRFVTGISIQRVGLSGFRRIAFSPQDGVNIRIRGVAASLHRPTYTQPTWISIKITEAQLVLDLTVKRHTLDNKTSKWESILAKIHRQIHYIRLFDIVFSQTSVTITGVGSFHVERFKLSVDTRVKTVDRSRLFRHKTADTGAPAEWQASLRSVRFAPLGKEAIEILDQSAFSVHSLVRPNGLHHASVALKIGRVTIPCDDLNIFSEHSPSKDSSPPFADLQAFDSIIKSLSEVQIALGYIGLSKRLIPQPDRPVYLNLSMKEVGLDIIRLDQQGPAHRTYFSRTDLAHQASLTATSLSAGLDYSEDDPCRMMHIPMLTALVRTTMPAKITEHLQLDNSKMQSILLANLVCTSPSIDLDPNHLPLLLALLQARHDDQPCRLPTFDKAFLDEILPKAVVTIAVQEPVVRVSLPRHSSAFEYDMIISSISGMTLTYESHYDESRYVASLAYRQTKHELYGQSAQGVRHDLLSAHTVEIQLDAAALPEPSVSISGYCQTLAVYLVEPEICGGLKQIVHALSQEVSLSSKTGGVSFLRKLPTWLSQVHIKISDLGVSVSDTDLAISKYARGVYLRLDSWALAYKARREEDTRPTFRRSLTSPSASPRKKPITPADGRRLTISIHELIGDIIDSVPGSGTDRFLSVPAFEAAFSTSTDPHGPLFHINAAAKTVFVSYSLYNHFAAGVAVLLLKRTFTPSFKHSPRPEVHTNDTSEITTIDLRIDDIHAKAVMPADPAMMLDIYGLETGRHRWASPFVRTRLVRLCVQTPKLPKLWSRVLTIKTMRVDTRKVKKKSGQQIVEESTLDISTEAVRIGVPHQLVVHAIFDNITNVLKAATQLHHHFITDSNEYILFKHPEIAKHVPKIMFRALILLFELEDDAFEYKLSTIYRTGIAEQRQRLVREAAFQLKCRSHNTDASKKPRRKHRYDTNGACTMSGDVRRSPDEARTVLHNYDAQSWTKRIDEAFASRKHAMRDIRSYFLGMDDEDQALEPVAPLNQKPSLACLLLSDLMFSIDKPSFSEDGLPQFMHNVGKGIPHDTQYGLLVPMHLNVSVGEARLLLRDYPLPMLHIPPIKPGQAPRLPSLSLHADLVLAEEYRDIESQRHVNVVVIPPERFGPEDMIKRFAIDIRRTISPVKTYSTMQFEINTSAPTRITWGTSYQPAIQDMMQVIEGFTKPAIDPSDRVGFWDKIRLSFHSRIRVLWKGDGDVHLNLKGSRDPYVVTGFGAGLVMVWRNNVSWQINQHDDPKQFMIVESGDYILAIPDFTDYARESLNDSDKSSSRRAASFKKVAMKLSGNVQWLGGLVFERDASDNQRIFDFKPHYDVVLKHPDYAKAENDEYDAFAGFRSHHIHMSLAIAAPKCRDWHITNMKASDNYNSVHLSPRFFTHFLDWWSLFSGSMSLPVRQGPLWSVEEKSSKKFGRHIATIKYNLLLSPVFLSHVYRHKSLELVDASSATGLKMKLDSLILDLHQRRERLKDANFFPRRNDIMRINQCQLDFISGDIRAVSASFQGQETDTVNDMSRFTFPDSDQAWIDMDDFIDVHYVIGSISDVQILPLATAPRFSYYRQTDHGLSMSGDTTSTSPFGNEDTHFCIMSEQNDPQRVRIEILQQRLDKVVSQMSSNAQVANELELQVVRDHTSDGRLQKRYKATRDFGQHLLKKKDFLTRMLAQLNESGESRPMSDETQSSNSDHSAEFNNRFVVHDPQIKWNNALRNIILRYIHQVSQRRGFVYYMSRKAVKFILDIIEEKRKREPMRHDQSPGTEDYQAIEDRIEQILADGKSFVNADDPGRPEASRKDDDISTEFTAQNSYHFRLIAPQMQLQSDKNVKSAVLIAARSMQLTVMQIMDKDRVMDEISGLVQRRFNAAIDCLQIFVTSTKTFSTEFLHMYSGNRYGTKIGSYWPPWVPVEVMYEFEVNPYGFSRVVQPTVATLRYDKFNTLRLKYNDDVSRARVGDADSPESRMDHLRIDFPEVRAICDSLQYFAMYIIVVDLLLYSEPLEKTRSERLEKIMLASDFSDLTGAPEMVETLQERITRLEEIKVQCQVGQGDPDHDDRVYLNRDLDSFEDELFFMMEAITTSQQRLEDRAGQDPTTGLLRRLVSAQRIAWHLVKEKDESLLEFQLGDCTFDRTDNNDGSNMNSIEIGLINGYNLLPNALYPQIIAPYSGDGNHNTKMLRVHWLMLEAIAGIPVVDYFEVGLVPLKVQLEREIAKQIFEYIFPGVGEKAFEGTGFSPFQIKDLLPSNKDGGNDNETDCEEPIDIDLNEEVANSKNGIGTPGAGTLESRLTPTLGLQDPKNKNNRKPSHNIASSGRHWPLFQHTDRSQSQLAKKSVGGSTQNLTSTSSQLSLVSLSGPASSVEGRASGKKTRGSTTSLGRDRRKDDKDTAQSDDLTQMVNRASNYMTLSVFKVHSLVLSLSYKGRGQRNLEDVHDLVFRLPALEYRNKTWSNLDLALQVKKDVVKALISHAGAIVGNKFGHNRPSKQQQLRIREMANQNLMMSVSRDMPNDLPRPPNRANDVYSDTDSDSQNRGGNKHDRSSLSVAMSDMTSETNSVAPMAVRPDETEGPNLDSSPEKTQTGEDGKIYEHNTGDLAGAVNRRLTGLSRRLRGLSESATVDDQPQDSGRKRARIMSGGSKLLRK